MDYIPDPLDNQRAPRKASTGAYWSKRYRTDHRLYIDPPPKSRWSPTRGGYSTETLTPLEELAAPKISSLPYVIQQLCRFEFWDRLGAASWPEKESAAAWLQGSVASFERERLDVAYDFEEIETRARRSADICRHIPTYEGINEYVETKGLSFPAIAGNISHRGCIARARSSGWWRRKFTRLYRRSAEEKLRATGFVRRRRGLYASSFAVSARRQQTQATDTWLRERVVKSDSGEQLNLFDVWKGSVANPAIRRAELMTRMKGFENIANELLHVAEFITLTCPSAFHRFNSDGKENPHYEGFTVRDGQAWLNRMWARARAKLKKARILIYGFRVAEPHHDGTPHWHMVLFCAPGNANELRRVLRDYWLSDRGDEQGAADHRIKFKAIDPKKGSATGYISKYVAKNIDGFEVGEDYEAGTAQESMVDHGQWSGDLGDLHDEKTRTKAASDASNTSARVGAWASLHGIRQFQQIGGPQVTIYRECRRIRESTPLVAIERARVPADAGDWAGFIKGVGGIEAGRKGTLSLWKEVTGECNQYDEAKGPQIVGVMGPLFGVKTHEKIWRVEKVDGGGAKSIETWIKEIRKRPDLSGSASALGLVSITVAMGPSLSDPHGWTNPNESSMYGPN
jgi:Bacteriophage replication gene A protein (GPA)